MSTDSMAGVLAALEGAQGTFRAWAKAVTANDCKTAIEGIALNRGNQAQAFWRSGLRLLAHIAGPPGV